MSRIGELSAMVIELRAEIARLKGLKERPYIKQPAAPSGMEKASSSSTEGSAKSASHVIHEDHFIKPIQPLPLGSRFARRQDPATRQRQSVEARNAAYRHNQPEERRGTSEISNHRSGFASPCCIY